MHTKIKGKVLAITGGMSTGKSTLLSILRRNGAAILSLDELAHFLYAPEKPLYRSLVACFGQGIVGVDGSIDRKVLGRRVFGNSPALAKLNRIVHPLLRREAALAVSRMRRQNRLVVVEAGPLLFELGLSRIVDGVIMMRASRRERLHRIMSGKSLSRELAEARLAASESAEKGLEKMVRVYPRVIEVDTTGPVERIDAAAVRILKVLNRWP